LKLKKINFSFWVCGSLWEDVTSGGVISFYWLSLGLVYAALDANPIKPIVWFKFFLETRLSYEFLEPLIDFLAG